MNTYILVTLGILIPFFGTALGAAAVFLLKKEPCASVAKALAGFAAGVMLAASVWSLLLPAIELAEAQGTVGWFPAAAGFFVGVGFLLALDALAPRLHKHTSMGQAERKRSLLLLAVTLHNIPEGMAVGVIFAGVLTGDGAVTLAGAFALSAGIAIQNIPEGAVVSMPRAACGKARAFGHGVLSGIVEPIGALAAVLVAAFVEPILPYVLSFAAGAMIYVASVELIPEAKDAAVGRISLAVGFALMMALDVALG